MYLSGIADEASQDIDVQIKVTQDLGWNAIESRNINGSNIHDITHEDFEKVWKKLKDSNVYINSFASAIGNWAKDVRDDFSITMAEIDRALPRMKRLGTKAIRIMSYKVLEGEDQFIRERYRRLNQIQAIFSGEGITVLHENCMNYCGMSYQHTLDLLEKVPGIKLVFDTGNPVIIKDASKQEDVWQDSWDFYSHVKDHIAYVHIKDGLNPDPENNKEIYTFPGEGQGYVREILADLKEIGYDGGISIEPHLASVFHNGDAGNARLQNPVEIYKSYGDKLMNLLKSIDYKPKLFRPNELI